MTRNGGWRRPPCWSWMEMRPVPFHAAGQIGEAGRRASSAMLRPREGVAGGIDGCGLNGDKPGPALGTLFVVETYAP